MKYLWHIGRERNTRYNVRKSDVIRLTFGQSKTMRYLLNKLITSPESTDFSFCSLKSDDGEYRSVYLTWHILQTHLDVDGLAQCVKPRHFRMTNSIWLNWLKTISNFAGIQRNIPMKCLGLSKHREHLRKKHVIAQLLQTLEVFVTTMCLVIRSPQWYFTSKHLARCRKSVICSTLSNNDNIKSSQNV